MGLSDLVFITGTGTILAYSINKALKEDRNNGSKRLGGGADSSPLGPGVSVARLTVAMNVPNRDAPTCILKKLRHLATTSRTETRAGLQALLSQGMYFIIL